MCKNKIVHLGCVLGALGVDQSVFGHSDVYSKCHSGQFDKADKFAYQAKLSRQVVDKLN